jgi:serine phosphatase RsbU (regulator of sigma subunit)
MGFRPGARHTSVEFELQGRDRILLYTDGITEASNAAGECFGERRLPQFIREQRQLPAGEFVHRLLHEVAQWSGQRTGEAQADDLTLVVIDVRST